ncbi:RNA polymerase subunit sigma-70 [Actinoalloteichus sp. AHMU CJ021]|nr:sigma-70 family RNA polymerase sigma factor [Actinoalloteichus caeruleus]AUS81474.1 RNA polymerase subunit sigma-70 [Actinoalloteichus sp. AHMU CJ021]
MVGHGDRELVEAAVGGADGAFDELVRRHTPRLYRVALRIVGDRADAEDVVQDAWISAWRALPRYRGDAEPSTWLYRVVTNAALGRLRRRRRMPEQPMTDAAAAILDTMPAPGGGPEAGVLRQERGDQVQRAIATLDSSQRVPLVLREFEGLDYEEIAAILGVGVPALRARLHRARVVLLGRLREVQ